MVSLICKAGGASGGTGDAAGEDDGEGGEQADGGETEVAVPITAPPPL